MEKEEAIAVTSFSSPSSSSKDKVTLLEDVYDRAKAWLQDVHNCLSNSKSNTKHDSAVRLEELETLLFEHELALALLGSSKLTKLRKVVEAGKKWEEQLCERMKEIEEMNCELEIKGKVNEQMHERMKDTNELEPELENSTLFE